MLMIASPDVYVIKMVINMTLIYSLYTIVCGGAGYWYTHILDVYDSVYLY